MLTPHERPTSTGYPGALMPFLHTLHPYVHRLAGLAEAVDPSMRSLLWVSALDLTDEMLLKHPQMARLQCQDLMGAFDQYVTHIEGWAEFSRTHTAGSAKRFRACFSSLFFLAQEATAGMHAVRKARESIDSIRSESTFTFKDLHYNFNPFS